MEVLQEEAQVIKETLEDVKNKLHLQRGINSLFEKQHIELKDLLGLPDDDRSFANVLKTVKAMKMTINEFHDGTEANHYAKAEEMYSSYLA